LGEERTTHEVIGSCARFESYADNSDSSGRASHIRTSCDCVGSIPRKNRAVDGRGQCYHDLRLYTVHLSSARIQDMLPSAEGGVFGGGDGKRYRPNSRGTRRGLPDVFKEHGVRPGEDNHPVRRADHAPACGPEGHDESAVPQRTWPTNPAWGRADRGGEGRRCSVTAYDVVRRNEQAASPSAASADKREQARSYAASYAS